MWLFLISTLDITLQMIFLFDDDDINRQRRTLFVHGNIILRKFIMCSLGVKLTLSHLLFIYVYSTTLVELQTNLPLLITNCLL